MAGLKRDKNGYMLFLAMLARFFRKRRLLAMLFCPKARCYRSQRIIKHDKTIQNHCQAEKAPIILVTRLIKKAISASTLFASVFARCWVGAFTLREGRSTTGMVGDGRLTLACGVVSVSFGRNALAGLLFGSVFAVKCKGGGSWAASKE
jgi:hypothetical protein